MAQSKLRKYDIFISYRRDSGSQYARILQLMLLQRGYHAFLDYNDVTDGRISKAIKGAIKDAPVFMLVLSKDSMRRCANENDWVRQEILLASRLGKHIVPVNPDNSFDGFPENVPEKVKSSVEPYHYSEINFGQTLGVTIDLMVQDRLIDTLGPRKSLSHKDEDYNAACETLERIERKNRFIRILTISSMVALLIILLGACIFFWKMNREKNALINQRIELQEKYRHFPLQLKTDLTSAQMQAIDELLGSMRAVDDTLFISQFEFTSGWWYSIMCETVDSKEKDMPMHNVSFGEIYLRLLPKLNEITSLTFDLPSPDEWEYAARGGQKNELYSYAGSDIVNRVAWYKDNSSGRLRAANGQTGLEPNVIDLYDMCGNVSEICKMAHDSNIYSYGGDYNSPANEVTISSRKVINADTKNKTTGFRVIIHKK